VSLGTVRAKSTVGSALAKDIALVLQEWGIQGKVSAFVIDGGGNLKSAIDALGREVELRAGLDEAANLLSQVRVQPSYRSSCWAHLMSLSIR